MLAQVKSLGSPTEEVGNVPVQKWQDHYDSETKDTEVQTDTIEAVVSGHALPTDGTWEPLEQQVFPERLRVRLHRDRNNIPAGEQGEIRSVFLGYCDVNFDNCESGTLLFPSDYFDAWVPRFKTLATQMEVNTRGHVASAHVAPESLAGCGHPGGSATQRVKRVTERDDIINQCQRGFLYVGQELQALERRHAQEMKLLRAEFDEWDSRLGRFQFLSLSDSSTQTASAASVSQRTADDIGTSNAHEISGGFHPR